MQTLERCGWNHSRAAEVLGIGRTTLWRKLKGVAQRDREGNVIVHTASLGPSLATREEAANVRCAVSS